jgi:hypothetical protein
MKISLSNIDIFKVLDENNENAYYGCNQEWYTSEWQRRSGCGPSVACNIITYLHAEKPDLVHDISSKSKCLSFMEEIWEYVTPTEMGIPTTKLFYDRVLAYAEAKEFPIGYEFCDIPEEKTLRPPLQEMIDFIETALIKNIPVAFLNLCNGCEENLDRWHWVTVISIDSTGDEKNAVIEILDEGKIKKIDLALWYHTTTQGGGFVCFI